MKEYTFIVPMDVEYNFYSKDIKTAIDTLLMNHNEAIKGKIWNDIHKIDGTECNKGATIIEREEDKEEKKNEKTYCLTNGKLKLLNEEKDIKY